MHQSCPSGMKLNIIVDHNSHLHLCIKKEKKKAYNVENQEPNSGQFLFVSKKGPEATQVLKMAYSIQELLHTYYSQQR